MIVYPYDDVVSATLNYFEGDDLATNVWITKYALKNKQGEFLEKTPDDMHKRLAKEFSRMENNFGGKRVLSEDEIFSYFDKFRFICPQGSPMFGIGNEHSLISLSNCCVVSSPKDSVSSIMNVGRDVANLFKRRAGCGIDISTLRPDGSFVNNSAKTSTGAWSFADYFSYICRKIGQSGRRGAAIVTMDVRHPDIFKFATMKHDLTLVTGANVSIKITDNFMSAVEKDLDFQLQFPVDSNDPVIKRVIKARDLWDVIINSATKYAEPGILMWDTIIKNLPAHEYEEFETVSTNPCCFSKDSFVLVKTRGGVKEIKEITSDDEVFISGTGGFAKTSGYFSSGISEVFKVNFSNNSELFITKNHKLGVPDFGKTSIVLKRLDELKTGNFVCLDIHDVLCDKHYSIFPYVTITSIESVGLKEVGCIEVEEYHRFTANGIISGNSELPLSAFDSCRLLAVNLKYLVNEPFSNSREFDEEKFKKIVSVSQRLSDDLVQLEIEKLNKLVSTIDDDDEIVLWNKFIEKAERGRRTGLGAYALADLLSRMCLKYDSNDAVSFIDKVFKTFRNCAYKESIELAKERGPFSAFNWETEKNNLYLNRLPKDILNDIEKYGRRNISLLTMAPTGSVSIVSKTSSGIEPVFRNYYTRRRKVSNDDENTEIKFIDASGDKWIEFNVVHKNVLEWAKLNLKGDLNQDSELPDYFISSDKVNFEKRVKIQGIITSYLDHSASSTINLPKGTTSETVGNIYMEAWKKGCKGITVYVDGSRSGVLIENKKEEDSCLKESFTPKRPESVPCDIHQISVKGNPWVVLVGKMVDCDGEFVPYEVFAGESSKIKIPKKYTKGSIVKRPRKTVMSLYDLLVDIDGDDLVVSDIVETFGNDTHAAFTRVISLSLRSGAPVRFVVEQLQKDKDSDMYSFSRACARVLKKYIKDGEKVTSDKYCSNCKKEGLIYSEGCILCTYCGWSKCA